MWYRRQRVFNFEIYIFLLQKENALINDYIIVVAVIHISVFQFYFETLPKVIVSAYEIK